MNNNIFGKVEEELDFLYTQHDDHAKFTLSVDPYRGVYASFLWTEYFPETSFSYTATGWDCEIETAIEKALEQSRKLRQDTPARYSHYMSEYE